MGLHIYNLFKLSTREDRFFIHKYLGMLCLVNFIYRYFSLFAYGDMGFGNTSMTPFSIVMHGLLSVSSLIFHVPKKRHKGKPMIYQEFRLHSIVFALRSVLCSLCFFYQLSIYYNIMIINLTMIVADIITYFFKTETKTMRGMPFGKSLTEEEERNITRMHSSQQFGATLFMMININSAFSPLFAIQLAAFLMTLVRKNIIDELDWHRIYAISLWINIFCYFTFETQLQFYYVLLSIRIYSHFRCIYQFNKYIIWNSILSCYPLFSNNYKFLSNELHSMVIIIITLTYLFRQFKKSKSLWFPFFVYI